MSELDYYHSDFIVLDTETTGLDKRAEIVEIAIIDKHGNTLDVLPNNPNIGIIHTN